MEEKICVTTQDYKNLLDAFYYDNGLSYILDTAYSMIKHPIAIFDTSYKILGKSSNNTSWNEHTKDSYLSSNAISAMRYNKIIERLHKENKIFYINDNFTEYGWLFVPITINNILVSFISIYEYGNNFSKRDYEIAEILSKGFSLKFQNPNLISTQAGNISEYILKDILFGNSIDISSIKERLSLHNKKLYENFFFISLRFAHNKFENQSLRLTLDKIKKMPKFNFATILDDEIVVFVSSKSEDIRETLDLVELEEFLILNFMICGISCKFNTLECAIDYYNQAKRSIELGFKFKSDDVIHYYDDYYMIDLFDIYSRSNNLNIICNSNLIKLKEYDDINNTNLLQTLYVYLINTKNPTLTSSALHIHRSTLFYRINKITDIINEDLNDGNVIFNLLLSYKIMKFNNNFKS